MANSNLMLQVELLDIISGNVVAVPQVQIVVFDVIRGEAAEVTEIADEKVGVFSGNNLPVTQITDSANARLWVGFPGQPYTYLHAPSHVQSPRFENASHVVLELREWGLTFDDDGDQLNYLRLVSAHAYVRDISKATIFRRVLDFLGSSWKVQS